MSGEKDVNQYRTPLEYEFLRRMCFFLAGLWGVTVGLAIPSLVYIISSAHTKQLASAVNALARAAK